MRQAMTKQAPLRKTMSMIRSLKLKRLQKGNVHKVSDAIWNTAGGVLAANLMLDDIEKYF